VSQPFGPGIGSAAAPVRLLALFLLLLPLVQTGCTFERRADLDEDPEAATPALEADERIRSPAAVVRVFRDAVVVGDLSLALSLLHRPATIEDELAGGDVGTLTRGELLMELRRRHVEGLVLEVLGTEVEVMGESAMVLTRLALIDQGEDGIGVEAGRAYETVLLVLTEEGWRIRHLHRSMTRREP
jgi:hypothetical protein